jgi:hypothetical protein
VYQEAVPVVDFLKLPREEAANRAFLTKSTHWKHEQEWRLVRLKITDRVLTYPPEALSGVIFGCRCPPESREEVTDWIRASGAKPILYEARQSSSNYALHIITSS